MCHRAYANLRLMTCGDCKSTESLNEDYPQIHTSSVNNTDCRMMLAVVGVLYR